MTFTSALPYAQLDRAKDLKTSDPEDLANAMVQLRELIPLKIYGGCCGTDNTHMRKIAEKICSNVQQFSQTCAFT